MTALKLMPWAATLVCIAAAAGLCVADKQYWWVFLVAALSFPAGAALDFSAGGGAPAGKDEDVDDLLKFVRNVRDLATDPAYDAMVLRDIRSDYLGKLLVRLDPEEDE